MGAEISIGARFLVEFTLSIQSEILRFAQDDSEGLGMTGFKSDSTARPRANVKALRARQVKESEMR